MKKAVLLVFALGILHGVLFAEDKVNGYSQKYVIFMDGKRAGIETVTEEISGDGDRIARSDSEIYVTEGLETNRVAHSTRMVLERETLKPKSYSYKYTTGSSGDSYEVEIRGDAITRTLHRGGEISVVTAEYKPDMVILDYDVYHQYDYLIQKYDEKKGGRQLFSDFLPVIGNDIPIALTFVGNSSIRYGRGELPVKNYKIEFIGLRSGMVAMDSNGRLARFQMPGQNLEVMREDLVPANR
jgi:hypothetical protein